MDSLTYDGLTGVGEFFYGFLRFQQGFIILRLRSNDLRITDRQVNIHPKSDSREYFRSVHSLICEIIYLCNS